MGAILAGLVFGVLAPSSTTQSILAANLVSNRKIAPENTLAFLLWANLGITVTVQLISLKVSALYPVPVILGAALFMFSRSRIPRALGQCLFSFGVIFLAMSLIGSAAGTLVSTGDMGEVVRILSRHPILLFVFAALAAFVLQSSMAVLGAFFAASNAGAFDLHALLPAVMGATVGIGITTLVTCWAVPGPRRRLAAAALVMKMGICVPVLLLLPQVVVLVSALPLSPAPQAAAFHGALNLLIALLATAVGPLLRSFFGPEGKPSQPSPLDYAVLGDIDLALACASRETLKMGESVRQMYEEVWRAPSTAKDTLNRSLHSVEEVEDEVSAYVSRMDWESMSAHQRELAFGLLNFATHLAVVADMLCNRLRPLAEKLSAGELELGHLGHQDLDRIREMVSKRLDLSTAVLVSRDPEVAKSFLELGSSVKRETILALKRQYGGGFAASTPDPSAFSSMVSVLRRISGQLNTIGHTFSPSLLEAADTAPEAT
jgi:phosphate:Na+ symporter